MAYAENTSVPVSRSKAEIEQVLEKYGASSFAYMTNSDKSIVIFEANKRRIRMELSMPSISQFKQTPSGRARTATSLKSAYEQEIRRKWRALFLVIKAKLEAVSSGISTFEEEFLAFVMLPDGSTVGNTVLPAIDIAYKTGSMIPLLSYEKENNDGK